jgi:hypothetical protein
LAWYSSAQPKAAKGSALAVLLRMQNYQLVSAANNLPFVAKFLPQYPRYCHCEREQTSLLFLNTGSFHISCIRVGDLCQLAHCFLMLCELPDKEKS